ncbi:MAG: hypothetical protein V4760_17305 [Bdellovibrionota bacterium]
MSSKNRFNYVGLFDLRRRQRIVPYTLPDPTRRRSAVDLWITIVSTLVVTLGLFLAAGLLYFDSKVTARIPFDASAWRVSFTVPQSGCAHDRIAGGDCPAAPENVALWESTIRRDSPDFFRRFKTTHGETFWLGLKVPKEELHRAAEAFAPVVILPRVNGLVQVWFDGVHQATHDFQTERLPLRLTLSKVRLVEEKDLSIVIRVLPYPHHSVPESSASSRTEGFFTPRDADLFTRSVVFVSTSRHLIALALFLLIAGFMWSVSTASRTRDYAVGTQLALLIALSSLVAVDLSLRVFNVANFQSIFFTLLVLEGVFISRLTWTILRGSRESSILEGSLLLAATFLVSICVPSQWIESVGASVMTSAVLPLVYLLCAIAVGTRLVRMLTRPNFASKTRIEFLILAALSLAATAVAYFVESSQSSGFEVTWSRWINFIVLFGLVRVFTKSNKTKGSLIELCPASRFHKLETLPEKVEGWILHLDILKFSTDSQVMSTILSHLWTITQLNDGDVIKADTRSLIVIFERKHDGSEAVDMVHALSEMAKCLKDLEERLPIVFADGSYATSILFRAAALKGAIVPTWQQGETGLSRLPVWKETDACPSLTDARELLSTDLDAAWRSNDASIVVMKKDEADELAERVGVPARSRVELEHAEGVVAHVAGRMFPRAPRSAKTDRRAV